MRRLRILVLTSTFPRWHEDSVPRFVLDLCRSLQSVHDLVVIAPHHKNASRSEDLDGVHVERFFYAPPSIELLAGEGGMLTNIKHRPWLFALVPAFLLGELMAAILALRRCRYDLIHAHWSIPQCLVAVIAKLVVATESPILCTCHGADLHALKGRFYSRVRGFALRRCSAITVVSSSMKAKIIALYPDVAAKVHVAPMGADLRARFVVDGSTRDPCTLLFVGRIVEKKGLPVLLEAMKALSEGYPELRLRIVGDGPMRYMLQTECEENGLSRRLSWLGSLGHDQIVGEYRRASILVFPSIVADDGDQEGLGLVPVEALGCGCAVIASDLPAIRDVIIDGKTGLLFTTGSSTDLVTRIQYLLEHPEAARKLAENGGDFVREEFDWTVVGLRYLRIIEDVVGRESKDV